MPVYNISGTVIAPLPAVDVLVDDGSTPNAILATALSEQTYNTLLTFFASVPSIPLDGSKNITETAIAWQPLMHWATQPYGDVDRFTTSPFVGYILALFELGANASAIVPPLWVNPGVIAKDTQPEVLINLLYVLRMLYAACGYPAPAQVP